MAAPQTGADQGPPRGRQARPQRSLHQAKPTLLGTAEAPILQASSDLSRSTTRAWVMEPEAGVAAERGAKAL